MGIPVIFEEQNINSIYPESEFLITIHGAFAQSESEGISSRVKWGKHQAMRTGKANIQYKTLLGYTNAPPPPFSQNKKAPPAAAYSTAPGGAFLSMAIKFPP